MTALPSRAFITPILKSRSSVSAAAVSFLTEYSDILGLPDASDLVPAQLMGSGSCGEGEAAGNRKAPDKRVIAKHAQMQVYFFVGVVIMLCNIIYGGVIYTILKMCPEKLKNIMPRAKKLAELPLAM
nr:hypothetical protein [uncultured bacterium]